MSTQSHTLSRRVEQILLIAVWAILLGGAGVAIYEFVLAREILGQVSWIHVKSVEVTVDWPLSEKEFSWLEKQKGQNIFKVDAASLVRRIRQNVWVSEVQISKRYPSEITVDITTKKPIAYAIRKGQIFALDSSGDTIAPAQTHILKKKNLPVVTGDEAKWKPKEVVSLTSEISAVLLKRGYELSQIDLQTPPYLSLFVSGQHSEFVLDVRHWKTNSDALIKLLDSPPNQTSQVQKIKMLFPKKAVVTSIISN